MKNVDLLKGSIVGAMTKLALPIMLTSFLQMAYNLIDMIWIGKVGSDAVAAVGIGSMFVWFAGGIIIIAKIGGQVKIGQYLGAQKEKEAAVYGKTAFQLAIIAGILFGTICIVFHVPLVGFFNLENEQIIKDSQYYIIVTCGGVLFLYLNQIFTGIWTALGNSRVTLLATLIGLSINIVLDPVLIFGYGPLPKLGVLGAALATVFAQFIVCLVFCMLSIKEKIIFSKMEYPFQMELSQLKEIVRIGLPAGIQSMMFTSISMIVSRMITDFGDAAIAVQKVGTQIESISWMTAEGFGTAVNAFTAQNYGANQQKRVNQGYRSAMGIMFIWGMITSILLVAFPGPIFQIFLQEEEMLILGIDYLKIVGYSQLFMCVELATAGAFQGLGKTMPPSIIGMVFIVLRIPLAYILCQTSLGLNGIWWAITISAILKGIILPLWFCIDRRKTKMVSY